MSIITTLPTPNLWEQVCQECQQEREQNELEEQRGRSSPTGSVQEFDPSKHHAAFYGKPFAHIKSDYSVKDDLDQAVSHPSCASYWISDEDGTTMSRAVTKPSPDKQRCSNRDYLEAYVWPTLLPALEKMLEEAQRQGCFGLKKMAFNALDYLTEHLYNHNPLYHTPATHDVNSFSSREKLPLLDIPFVQSWLRDNPRPPLRPALTWTEDETASKIQGAWRAYVTRRDPEIQELRKWQEEWRFMNREGQIQEEVSGFWDRVMSSPSSSLGGDTAKKSSRHRIATGYALYRGIGKHNSSQLL